MATPFSVHLVDDNPWHVELVRCLLDDDVFTLTHWDSPREAWNGINESPAADTVILDLDPEGPVRTGMGFADLIDHLRVRWPTVPLIVLGSQLDADAITRSRVQDVKAVVSKPYDIRYLVTTIYGVLRERLDNHVEELNRQHVHLSREFRRLQGQKTPSRADINRALQLLSSHFHFEEAFMQMHGYPRITQHKAAHEKLLVQARRLIGNGQADAETIRRFWRGVKSDLNDDADYLAFLDEVHTRLTARLQSS